MSGRPPDPCAQIRELTAMGVQRLDQIKAHLVEEMERWVARRGGRGGWWRSGRGCWWPPWLASPAAQQHHSCVCCMLPGTNPCHAATCPALLRTPRALGGAQVQSNACTHSLVWWAPRGAPTPHPLIAAQVHQGAARGARRAAQPLDPAGQGHPARAAAAGHRQGGGGGGGGGGAGACTCWRPGRPAVLVRALVMLVQHAG